MANAPIGISFIPSTQNQAQGPANLSIDGGGGRGSTDLAQAYKVLSLRLPTTVSASAPVSPTLLNSAGSSGVQDLPGGLSPYAALFQALLKSQLGVGAPSGPSAEDTANFDASALAGYGSLPSAPISGEGDPNAIGAGSSLPGAMTPPVDTGRVVPRVQFPGTVDRSVADAPSPGGWQDWIGGKQDYVPAY